jgi:hypothetical protein
MTKFTIATTFSSALLLAPVCIGVAGAPDAISVSTATTLVSAGAVASIPASQAYYWSRKWQDDELESRRELAAGLGVEFDTMDEMIAWLEDGDDV